MTSWIKAGLIGGAALSVIYVLYILSGYVPVLGIAICCVLLLAYLLACGGTGALAAHWLPAPRDAGAGAGQGALAAGLAGLIGGVVNAIAMTILFSAMNWADLVSQIPPDVLDWLTSLGVTTEMLQAKPALYNALFGGGCCCGVGVIAAVVLGAAGGAIWAAARPNE